MRVLGSIPLRGQFHFTVLRAPAVESSSQNDHICEQLEDQSPDEVLQAAVFLGGTEPLYNARWNLESFSRFPGQGQLERHEEHIW